MVGEQLDAESGEVLGVVLAPKFNSDTISIWHRTASSETVREKLKASIEKVWEMDESMKIEYENFKEVRDAPHH